MFVCSCQAHNSLLAEEEATALSIWAVACMCGTLRLENVISVLTCDFLESMFLYLISQHLWTFIALFASRFNEIWY